MKYIYLFLLTLAYTLNIKAQYYYPNDNIFNDSILKANQVKQITTNEVHIYKGKSTTFKEIKHINKDGICVMSAKLKDTLKMLYLSEFNMISLNYSKKNYFNTNFNKFYKHNEYRISELSDDNKLVRISHFNKKGKLTYAINYEYKDSVFNRVNYINKKGKLSGYYLYEYGPNKKLKTSSQYNAKGKLIRLWDYSCNDEGSKINKAKDTFKICSNKTYLPDGVIITTTNTFTSDGKPIKNVEYTNANNKVIKYFKYYGANEILFYKQENLFVNNQLKNSYAYYATYKGEHYRSTVKKFNENNQIVSQTDSTFRKKLGIISYQFEYNKKGLIESQKRYNNGAIRNIEMYKYQYYLKP